MAPKRLEMPALTETNEKMEVGQKRRRSDDQEEANAHAQGASAWGGGGFVVVGLLRWLGNAVLSSAVATRPALRQRWAHVPARVLPSRLRCAGFGAVAATRRPAPAAPSSAILVPLVSMRGLPLVRQPLDLWRHRLLGPAQHLDQPRAHGFVLGCDQGVGRTRGAGPARPADPVHVRLRRLGAVVVDHGAHLLDVQTALRHVGSHQQRLLPPFELLQHPVALVLGFIAVNGKRRPVNGRVGEESAVFVVGQPAPGTKRSAMRMLPCGDSPRIPWGGMEAVNAVGGHGGGECRGGAWRR
eukprot:scaffold10240_cov107-Isochrysis_galbana.AAC.8